MNEHYNDKLLTEGTRYTIGMNDGCTMKNVIFEGTKQFYGKTMMCFRTNNDNQITVNPSYFSFSIEGETDMNPVKFKQGEEVAWENSQ